MISLIVFTTLFIGVLIHNCYLKSYEIRLLLKISIYIEFLGALFSLMFATRLNLAMGISDLYFIVVTSIFTDTLGLAFSKLPMLVLFTKITPKNIEATMYAFLTGVFNIS